ncbi:MAG: hypothetical protein IT184_12485 [Acidobacteria bacterium]|nr:hypothetical protein [Acidobacteriota bacterium]
MEPGTIDLHGQIDQMNAALREWRQAQLQLEPLEARLKLLTERGAELLDRWAAVDQRHAQAIADVEARLREFRDVESRLQHEALDRLRGFERAIQHEWAAVRDMHEEPLRQVRAQALALAETCRATADLSLRSYERAEARLAALESDLRADVSALTREVRTALGLVQGGQALAPPAAPFPLDSVLKIHEEEREVQRGPVPVPRPQAALPAVVEPAAPPPELPPIDVPVAPFRLREVPRPESPHAEPPPADAVRSLFGRRVAAGGVVLVLAIAAWGGTVLVRQLRETAERAANAERTAAAMDAQLTAARAELQRQGDAAARAMERATLLGDVLAAPDLFRFPLVGTEAASGASGHVIWSRSRGIAVSVFGLASPGAGSTHQVWLTSPEGAVHVGQLVPDANGASLVTRNPASLPRPVTGVQVTLERADSIGRVPAGPLLLARAPQPAPASE